MKTVIAILAVGSALTAVPAMAADGIQPGLWKITTTVVNNGAQMPPQTKPRCLTAEQAGDLADTFSPRFGGVNTTCQRTEYSKTDQKLTWRLECRGQWPVLRCRSGRWLSSASCAERPDATGMDQTRSRRRTSALGGKADIANEAPDVCL